MSQSFNFESLCHSVFLETGLHIHICTYTCMHMHACTQTHTHADTHLYTHADIHKQTPPHMHVLIHTNKHTPIICTCWHTHADTHKQRTPIHWFTNAELTIILTNSMPYISYLIIHLSDKPRSVFYFISTQPSLQLPVYVLSSCCDSQNLVVEHFSNRWGLPEGDTILGRHPQQQQGPVEGEGCSR